MNIAEYNVVKNMEYYEYCEYLKKKYGCVTVPYFNIAKKSGNWNKNSKVTRSREGLVVHHIKEDVAIMLCSKDYAIHQPYEYQQPQFLVYCDYLEHLLLHVMISEHGHFPCGVGGVINFIVPELNDWYSGYRVGGWRINCWERVKDDVDCYIEIVNRFMIFWRDEWGKEETTEIVATSCNEKFGTWSVDKNRSIIDQFV